MTNERTETNACDSISREAAIKALAKFVPYAICDESTESYTNGLTDAYNLICQLPSTQRWIPCSERLPEDKTAYYLATIANHGLFFTTTLNNNVECVRWDYDRRKGQDSWHWCTERTVIAWMPLPEPYREEGEK